MAGQKKCPFCGRSSPEVKFTKEHILRDKFNDLFPWAAKKSVWINKTTDSNGEMKTRKITLPHSQFEATVNTICEKCNNGWMNSLENSVEPYLRGLTEGTLRLLTPEKRHLISTWAAKTAGVIASKHRDDLPEFPAGHCKFIMDNGSPPPYTHIWIERTVNNEDVHTRYCRAKVSDASSSGNFYLATIAIGYFAIYILGTEKASTEKLIYDEIALRENLLLTRIWPVEGAGEITLRRRQASIAQMLEKSTILMFADKPTSSEERTPADGG